MSFLCFSLPFFKEAIIHSSLGIRFDQFYIVVKPILYQPILGFVFCWYGETPVFHREGPRFCWCRIRVDFLQLGMTRKAHGTEEKKTKKTGGRRTAPATFCYLILPFFLPNTSTPIPHLLGFVLPPLEYTLYITNQLLWREEGRK